MKIKFRMISVLIAAMLTLSLAGQCLAAGTSFTDLENVSAREKILALQENGYVNGIADGIFAPKRILTGAEGVQLIVNALELNLDKIRFIKEPKASDSFPKANDDAWYANALIVAFIYELDLPNDFDPSQEWTREEFTYRLVQAMYADDKLPMVKLVPANIADQDQMTIDYSGSIQHALLCGIVKLDAEEKFNPKAKISRAEAAEQVYNALEYIKAHPAPIIDSTGMVTK